MQDAHISKHRKAHLDFQHSPGFIHPTTAQRPFEGFRCLSLRNRRLITQPEGRSAMMTPSCSVDALITALLLQLLPLQCKQKSPSGILQKNRALALELCRFVIEGRADNGQAILVRAPVLSTSSLDEPHEYLKEPYTRSCGICRGAGDVDCTSITSSATAYQSLTVFCRMHIHCAISHPS